MGKQNNKEKKTKEKTTLDKEAAVKKARVLKGVVISDKMDKTIVVLVARLKKHPRYKKRYRITKKYKACDEKNQFKIGDNVVIRESRPMSKTKKWIVLQVGNKEAQEGK